MTAQGRIATLIAVLAFSVFTYHNLNNQQDIEVIDISDIKTVDELPTPVLEAENFLVKVDAAEFDCMRTNMYYEARNQKSDDAYIAVGYTVKNRAGSKGYPSSLCGVVKEKRFAKRKNRWVCQYSWFCDGKSDEPALTIAVKQKVKGKWVTKIVPNTIERAAWDRAGQLAIKVMRNEVDNPIGNATMYHATYVSPAWDFKKLKQVAHIETHVFYSTKKA